VTAAVLVGAGPALTEDIFHTRWGEQAPAPVIETADVTALDVADPVSPAASARFLNLLRVDETPAITVAPTVSQQVLSTQTVRKVGYGRVETVEIVTTPTGTYSSDAVASSHVLYPGIDKEEPAAATGLATLFALVGGNWAPLTFARAGSFIQYGSGFGTRYRTDGQTTCLSGKGYTGCL
jgi:hypothetical protein